MGRWHNLLMRTPRFRGKNFLFRNLYASTISSGVDLTLTGRGGAVYKVPNIIENVGFDIFVNGIYEPDIVSSIARSLPVKGLMLDIGGNIGAISIPVALRRPDVRIVSVEASPWIFEYLLENIGSNHLKNVEALNYAVYNEAGQELDFYSPKDKYGKGSFASVFSKDRILVRTTTIDELALNRLSETPHLIKVDVEGFEHDVFLGGQKLLSASDAPVIFFEFVDWAEQHAGKKPGDAQRLLHDFGYQIFHTSEKQHVRLDRIVTSGGYNFVAIKP